MVRINTKAAKRELFCLLDAFPMDAMSLHFALLSDAFDGASGARGSCACAIATIGTSAGVEWGSVAAALGRFVRDDSGHLSPADTMRTLPALEKYVSNITPSIDDEHLWMTTTRLQRRERRRGTVLRWIEFWYESRGF